VRLLLDTHTFLWFIGGDVALSSYARHLIEDPAHERLLSIASLWEMAIKVSLGRLTVPLPFTALVAEHVYGNAIELFEILPRHLDALTTLPFYHNPSCHLLNP
jgi:PIN domain nuclease of toxin-antitoxin system